MKKIVSLMLAVIFITSFATVASAHTMYAPDGRTANVKDSEISKWEAVGWYRNKADVTKTLYAPDGRTISVWKSQVNSYLNVGWYDYPVIKMYALDGRTAVFAASAAPAQNKVGWYYSPVVQLYAPDGRTIVVAESQAEAYGKVGWYAYPVYDSNINEQIFNQFNDAYWFYWAWIEKTAFTDYNRKIDNFIATNHSEINTKDKLVNTARYYFTAATTNEMINYMNPVDYYGTLYVKNHYSMPQVGGFSFTSYTVENISYNTCILNVVKTYEMYGGEIKKVLCTYEDGKWKFANVPGTMIYQQLFFFDELGV